MEAIEQPRGIQPQPPILDDQEAEMARAAQRCIMAALDQSRAATIALVSEDADGAPATVEVPPAALRVIAQVLGAMGERKAVTVVPSNHELSTIQAAHFLNVSRPFVIKEIEAGRLPHRMVGTHRRINFDDLLAYRARTQATQRQALQNLADSDQDLGY